MAVEAQALPILDPGYRARLENLSPRGPDVAAMTVRGGAYLAARYGLGVLVSVANMLVMTWWIGPHAYGLFVTAIGLVAFLALVARGGIDTYLVRCDASPDDSTYGTAIALVLGASAALVVAAVVATPLLIRWFGSREFVLPYLTLLVTIPVAGLTGIPMAKLERALEFRAVAGIELSSQAAGLLVAGALAWGHAGVWAPVVGQIVWQVVTLVATLSTASLKLRFRFDSEQAWKMISFGAGMTASLRTWQLRTLVNPLLVGRFAGSEAVAFVALAIRIAESLGAFRLAAARMAIAALARLQSNGQAFARLLERALYLQVITLGPLLCVFGWCGPLALRYIIGTRWTPTLAVFPFIAAGILINSIFNLQASGLFVLGKQWVVLQSYLIHIVLLAGGTLVLLPRLGIAGYGWAEILACAAYRMIHSAMAASIPVSYRRVVPWTLLFLATLFLASVVHLFQPSS